jgi:hypothetical protein
VRRQRIVAASSLALSLTLAACAVPHQRDVSLDKVAARDADVTEILRGYREVRNTAVELLDPKPLSTVETGAVLAIDTGSFEVSQRLAQTQDEDTGRIEVTRVETPRFSKYPLWFYTVVRDPAAGLNRVQIFQRTSSADPWLLTASPQTLADTTLPDVRRRDGAAVRVAAGDATGMAMSPQAAADAYAAVLADPAAASAGDIADDSFIQQMRATAATNAGLKDVTFSQTWEADDVQYVLRTADGGALAFVTLMRQDTYTVDDGLTITWPEGSPQQAFLSSGIAGSGQLTYYHQVLLKLPAGSGKPRALGQYGGVVDGEGGAISVR